MQKARKVALAKAMNSLVNFGRPVRQVAAAVGLPVAYRDDYIRKGFGVVPRPWGWEFYK